MNYKNKIAVICIGDELLIGQVTDTNSGDIARHIEPYGWSVNYVQIVGDDRLDIITAINRAFDISDVVITTGGLGPTKDDITKGVLCEYFGGTLYENQAVLENVKEIVSKRGLKLNDLTAAQAIVPTSCRVIQNRVGTAPILWFEKGKKILVSMPGVPFETREMFQSKVFPMLTERFPSDFKIAHRTIIVTDISESDLATRLSQWETNLPESIHLAYLPKPGIIRLRLDAFDEGVQLIDQYAEQLISLTSDKFLFDGDLTPAEILLKRLIAKDLTISTAESCTGGSIASSITAIPGASAAFLCGIVAYSNDIKTGVLGVSHQTLSDHGAVSIPVVREMAEGVRRISGSFISIATSGIAGPGGATPNKPVGTVAIAVSTPTKTYSEIFHFPGNRSRIIDRAVSTGLVRAIRLLSEFE